MLLECGANILSMSVKFMRFFVVC